jgi:hypothetical protein
MYEGPRYSVGLRISSVVQGEVIFPWVRAGAPPDATAGAAAVPDGQQAAAVELDELPVALPVPAVTQQETGALPAETPPVRAVPQAPDVLLADSGERRERCWPVRKDVPRQPA